MRDIHGRFVRLPVIKGYRMLHAGGRNVHLHRVRAEQALGKPLPPLAVVHHADGTKRDDGPLVICENEAYHQLLHSRMRIKAAGGDPNTERICVYCRAIKPISAFVPGGTRINKWMCRSCPVLRQRIREGRQRHRQLDGVA